MRFIDDALLLLMILVPLAGASYVAVVPRSDRGATRSVSLAVALGVVLLAFRGAYLIEWTNAPLRLSLRELVGGALLPDVTLVLGQGGLPLVAVTALTGALVVWNELGRDLAPLRPFVIGLFILESLTLFALVVEDPLFALAAATATTAVIFFIVAIYGQAQRGSVSLSAAVFFIVTDTLALLALLLQRHDPDSFSRVLFVFGAEVQWLVVFLTLAGLARLCVFPLSAWLSGFVDGAPLIALALVPGFLFPLGSHLFSQLALPALANATTGTWWTVAGCGLTGLFWAGLLALKERNLRRLLGHALMFNGAAFALLFVALSTQSRLLAPSLVANSALSLLFVALVVAIVERELDGADGLALLGLADRAPRLFRLVLLAGLFIAVCPGIGGGTLFWLALPTLAHSQFFQSGMLQPNTGLALAVAVVVAWVLFATGVATTWRRMLTPARRQDRILDVSVTWPDTIRAWVTAVLALFLGLASPLWVPTPHAPTASDTVSQGEAP
jgi:NADH-quinone oxidoreductase subunit M